MDGDKAMPRSKELAKELANAGLLDYEYHDSESVVTQAAALIREFLMKYC